MEGLQALIGMVIGDLPFLRAAGADGGYILGYICFKELITSVDEKQTDL